MTVVPIKGKTSNLSIEVLDYENANASNSYDANWLSCVIRIEIGPFQARYTASLTTDDFLEFSESLQEVLCGSRTKSIFSTFEEWLRIEICASSSGTSVVSGQASDISTPDVSLRFAFEIDMISLERTLWALRSVVKKFPNKCGVANVDNGED